MNKPYKEENSPTRSFVRALPDRRASSSPTSVEVSEGYARQANQGELKTFAPRTLEMEVGQALHVLRNLFLSHLAALHAYPAPRWTHIAHVAHWPHIAHWL